MHNRRGKEIKKTLVVYRVMAVSHCCFMQAAIFRERLERQPDSLVLKLAHVGLMTL